MYKQHECDYLPNTGVSIVYADCFLHGEEAVWNLVIERQATEEDLEENHYLENVGDSIWQTIVEIYCCPFCGCTLSKPKDKGQAGNFIHQDSSSWNLRIC